MSLISLSRVGNNLIVFGVLFAIGFMFWNGRDKEKGRDTIEGLKKLFGGKKDG